MYCSNERTLLAVSRDRANASIELSNEAPQMDYEACENIGPKERRKRMLYRLPALVIGLMIGFVLIASGADRAWRIALFLPFASAGVGFFQAYEHT